VLSLGTIDTVTYFNLLKDFLKTQVAVYIGQLDEAAGRESSIPPTQRRRRGKEVSTRSGKNNVEAKEKVKETGKEKEKDKDKGKEIATSDRNMAELFNIRLDWWQLCWDSFSLSQEVEIAEWATICEDMVMRCQCPCGSAIWPFGWVIKRKKKDTDGHDTSIYSTKQCIPKGNREQAELAWIIPLEVLTDISKQFEIWTRNVLPTGS
jgi:hypothetical protein